VGAAPEDGHVVVDVEGHGVVAFSLDPAVAPVGPAAPAATPAG
jgi:hypothetical protein